MACFWNTKSLKQLIFYGLFYKKTTVLSVHVWKLADDKWFQDLVLISILK